jgi:hypothetical protein
MLLILGDHDVVNAIVLGGYFGSFVQFVGGKQQGFVVGYLKHTDHALVVSYCQQGLSGVHPD